MKRLGGTYARLIDDLIRERTGIATGHHQGDVEQRVLNRAMERAGVSDEAGYFALLQRDSKAFDELIADLTVPETYFFRDPPHYEMLRREVLPAILTARTSSDTIEVWSAGCATGEEPYSLAMLLEQELLGERSNVLGSDISVRAIARAKRAIYSRWSLRATRPEQATRYFEQVGREFRLSPRVRRKVRFQQHSLSAEAYPRPLSRAGGFDLILCRNVLIYFEPKAILEVGQKLAKSLASDGFLLMGPSDPLLEIDEWCDKIATPCGLLYKRRLMRAITPAPEPRKWKPHRHGHNLHMPPRSEPPRPLPQPTTPLVARKIEAPAQAPLEEVRALVRAHGISVAESGCRDLLARHPLDATLQWMHATLLYDLGRHDDASEALRRALYLDRTLLVAQMLSATLAEQRGELIFAERLYASLVREASALPAEAAVLLGDGLTHGALASLATQRLRAIREGRSA